MNLEEALYELTKNPISMIASDGHAYPALRFTSKTHKAITWLVDRFNDGTLKVEGYDHHDREMSRFRKRKGNDIQNGEYLALFEFMRKSGFSYKDAVSIGKRAGAYIPGTQKGGTHSFINVPKFYEFLNNEGRINRGKSYVSLMEAVKITGLEAYEIREQIAKGIIKEEPYVSYSHRPHKIHYDSLMRYVEKLKKGENDGKDDSDNGQVY